MTAGGGKRGASGPSSVSGQTASASCFGGMICRGPGAGALGLLPEASAMPIGPDGSREERGMSTRWAVEAAALVLWEASPHPRCFGERHLQANVVVHQDRHPGHPPSADVMPHPHNLVRGRFGATTITPPLVASPFCMN